MPDASTLGEHITNLLSRLVWGFDQLLPLQIKALLALIKREPITNIYHTDGGNSHIIQLDGTIMHRVHLIFHQILTLTADQLTQFLFVSDVYGSIVAINLNEMFTTVTRKRRSFSI